MGAMTNDEDLREAAASGYLLIHERELPGGVRLESRVLRYDPELPDSVRAPLVRSQIGGHVT